MEGKGREDWKIKKGEKTRERDEERMGGKHKERRKNLKMGMGEKRMDRERIEMLS